MEIFFRLRPFLIVAYLYLFKSFIQNIVSMSKLLMAISVHYLCFEFFTKGDYAQVQKMLFITYGQKVQVGNDQKYLLSR